MTDGYRLSQRQQHLWDLHGRGIPLGFPLVVALDGPVDPERLRRALLAVAARHQSLRTRFRTVAEMSVPVQVVSEESVVGWRVIDSADQGSTLDDLWERALTRSYAIEDASPLDATLVPAQSGGALLVIGLSALAADADSVATLVGDLRGAYHGEPANGDVPGYLQFSAWQNDLLEGGGDERAAAHWRRVRAVSVPRPSLPLEGAALRGTPRAVSCVLEPSLAAAIRALAQVRRTSVDSLLLTAWAVLLLRLTGVERLTIWRTLDGRKHADLYAAVGPFARPVPTTVTAGPESRFADVLAQVEYQHAENERWLDWLDADGATADADSFGFASVAWPPSAGGFSIDRMYDGGLSHDVSLVHRHIPEAVLELRYRHRLLHDGADVLLEQLQLVLTAACADPELSLRSMPVVTCRELALMDAANDTGAGGPDVIPLPRLFEQQATITPGRPATACGDVVLSYADLDRQSNRVANTLRSRGLGPGSICAFWHQTGTPVLEGLLGILKSGAAYLPIDPNWPLARVSAILGDAGPDLLLTQESLLSWVGTLPPLPILCLDRDADVFATAPATRVDAGAEADDLAYLIYTSGSTGAPKGVCVTHRGLANYLTWCRDAYPLTAGRGSLVHSSIGFDLTVTALFAPLLAGRCVQFTAQKGVEALVRTLTTDDGFSVLKVTPAHLRLLLQMLPDDRLAMITHALVIGGEALTEDMVAPWRAAAPHVRLFNEYGPTETAVGCCVHDGTAPSRRRSVPIGHPIAATRLYVLDEAMRRVPLGVVGELHIGGAGIARGYFGRPDLTAERFVPDPFSADVGSRLYRSGDLVRHLSDGTIEFVGRVDDQEQVNGFRVEPAEIEAALALHPHVRATAVAVQRHQDGSARILAAVVPNATGTPDPDELARFLRERLPEHLVPASIASVDALPLTPSGKVDRRAVLDLPKGRRTARPEARGETAARTPTEQVVTRVFEDALGYQGIGLEDNFFDVGGDSILLIDVAWRLKSELRAEVTPLMLFEHPTIAAIARVLDGTDTGDEAPDSGEAADPSADRIRRQRHAIDQARSRRINWGEP